jgi:hypothetical protein
MSNLATLARHYGPLGQPLSTNEILSNGLTGAERLAEGRATLARHFGPLGQPLSTNKMRGKRGKGIWVGGIDTFFVEAVTELGGPHANAAAVHAAMTAKMADATLVPTLEQVEVRIAQFGPQLQGMAEEALATGKIQALATKERFQWSLERCEQLDAIVADLGGLILAKPKAILKKWSGEERPSSDEMRHHLTIVCDKARKEGLLEKPKRKRVTWPEEVYNAFLKAVEAHDKKTPDDKTPAMDKVTPGPIVAAMGQLISTKLFTYTEVKAKLLSVRRRAKYPSEAPAAKKAKKANL